MAIRNTTVSLDTLKKGFDHVLDHVVITDPSGRILYANEASAAATGFSPDEVIGKKPGELWGNHMGKKFYKALWRTIRSEKKEFAEMVKNTRKNGEVYYADLRIYPVLHSDGKVKYYIAIEPNISDRVDKTHSHEKVIKHLSRRVLYDKLTGIPNRYFFDKRLGEALKNAKSLSHARFAVMFIDLDKFKYINDTYGHDVGDLVLKDTAKRIRAALGKKDMAARLGGDEFAVLLHNIETEDDAVLIAKQILDRFSTPLEAKKGVKVTLSTSIGISLYPEHGKTKQTLLKKADTALYQVKQGGRGNFRVFEK